MSCSGTCSATASLSSTQDSEWSVRCLWLFLACATIAVVRQRTCKNVNQLLSSKMLETLFTAGSGAGNRLLSVICTIAFCIHPSSATQGY